MTISSPDVRQHLNDLIQEIFPNGSNSSAWASAWNLVLGLMRRYSSTGITMAILRAEAHCIVDAIQSTRWQKLSVVRASSHDSRCRVRVLGIQPLRPSSPTLVATVADLDDICTRAAFIHRRYALWALQWKSTTLRLGGVRLAAGRILPTEQVVEEIAAKGLDGFRADGCRIVGRVIRRRDLHGSDERGTCLWLQALNDEREIQWLAFGSDANVSRLVFAGEIIVIENFDRNAADGCADDSDGALIIRSRPETIVRVVHDADPDALQLKFDDPVPASQFIDALSQANLTPASSQRDSDTDLLDARDLDGQRLTIRSVLDVNGPVVNVSLTAIICDVDRQRQLCYITDASRAVLSVRTDFKQSESWERGQTLFLYRLQSSNAFDVLTAQSGAQMYNLSYALGLLASPNLYLRVAWHDRPRELFSMFICRISIKKVHFPNSLAQRWHEHVVVHICSDQSAAQCCFISMLALESLLTCPLSVFAGIDQATRSSLVVQILNQAMLAMITTLQDDALRLEMLRPVSGIPRPSHHV